jgi:hypothetical protein
MGIVDTADPGVLEYLGVPGEVHSVAVSPDGSRYAFVLRDLVSGQPDNRITVVDLGQNTNRTFTLLAPVLDGNAVDQVLHADSMVFTPDGNQLVYDAVSQIRFGSGSPVQRWSIFRLDLPTATSTVLVPPLEGYDTGNPNLGRAGNRYLTFDAGEIGTGHGVIINLDLFTGDFATVGVVGQGVGYPCFTGDESGIIYATRDATSFWTGYSLARQALSSNRLVTSGQPTLWYADAALGAMYRRGTYTATNAPAEVALTAPAPNAAFAVPATIVLAADASDSDGIARVEFYAGSTKLGEDNSAPFGWTWANVSAGSYRLYARAIDMLGGASDSAAVTITVGSAGPIEVAAQRIANAIRLTVRAAPGSYEIEDSTNLTQWTTAFPLTVGVSGTASLDDTRVHHASGRLFYRIKRNP